MKKVQPTCSYSILHVYFFLEKNFYLHNYSIYTIIWDDVHLTSLMKLYTILIACTKDIGNASFKKSTSLFNFSNLRTPKLKLLVESFNCYPSCTITPSYTIINFGLICHPTRLFHPTQLLLFENCAILHIYSILHDY